MMQTKSRHCIAEGMQLRLQTIQHYYQLLKTMIIALQKQSASHQQNVDVLADFYPETPRNCIKWFVVFVSVMSATNKHKDVFKM